MPGSYTYIRQEVLGRISNIFLLIRHWPHRKRCVQQFFCCCVCIRCRGNIVTEPLPSNDKGIHIYTHSLMGGIYEVHRWDELRCHDIYTKFHNDWFRHSNVDRGESRTHRQHGDLISILLFSQNKESGLKTLPCFYWRVSMVTQIMYCWNAHIKRTPWLWSASELCRPSDRRLLAK
jgi:hypothetical protein